MATGRVPTTANSPLTAKGDLFGYSTTQARVPVGADGETIVADSSTTTGLRYTAGTVQSNPVLNSAMQVWQRGTSGTANGTAAGTGYNADRWWNYYAGTITVSRQATGDTTNLPFIQYCARVQRNSGQTSATTIYHGQDLETLNSIPYAGKSVSLSFYARKGANFSGASSNLSVAIQSGTGTDQHILGGYTGSTVPIASTATLTTTWQRFTYTGTVPTNSTQLGLYFYYDGVGTAGAADYFEVTGVQLDIGSVALPFRTYAGTIQGETSACQRYYYRTTSDSAYSIHSTFANASSTTVVQGVFQMPVTMRVEPTSIDYATLAVTDWVTTTALTTLTIDSASSSRNAVLLYTGGATGLTQYRPYVIVSNGSTNGYVGISAEL